MRSIKIYLLKWPKKHAAPFNALVRDIIIVDLSVLNFKFVEGSIIDAASRTTVR
jgi:hypothetical protein